MPFYECKDQKLPRAIITCDCVGECTEIHIMKDSEEVEGKHGLEKRNTFYISIQPKSNFKVSFWHRLKCAWKVLTAGGLYEDNIVLEASTIIDLNEWLIRNNAKPSLSQLQEYDEVRKE
jgi:hypothetical protein